MIQQVALAIGNLPQPVQEAGQQRDMIRVDFGVFFDLLRDILVV